MLSGVAAPSSGGGGGGGQPKQYLASNTGAKQVQAKLSGGTVPPVKFAAAGGAPRASFVSNNTSRPALSVGSNGLPAQTTSSTGPSSSSPNVQAAIRAALMAGMASGNYDGASLLNSILGNLQSGKYVTKIPGATSTSYSNSVPSVGSPGNYNPPTPGSPAAASLTPVASGARQGQVTMGDLQQVGKAYGWTQPELDAWWQVIQLESGGNPTIKNSSSGAYGIGQFLGATASEYAPYGALSGQVMPELNAMAKYMHDRYGGPTGALSFHLNPAHNWY